MNFEELLEQLGEHYTDAVLYSVEDRDMTDHETTITYFFEKEKAIAYAESLWATIAAEDKDYREISVHRGEIDYLAQFHRYRFVVLQKLFKAYKKIYVCAAFAEAFQQKRKNAYLADGLTEEAAAAEAKKEFQSEYAIQPAVASGMFAGYDYAPVEKE